MTPQNPSRWSLGIWTIPLPLQPGSQTFEDCTGVGRAILGPQPELPDGIRELPAETFTDLTTLEVGLQLVPAWLGQFTVQVFR